MEEKIYDRQVNKISLASRVVDEQNLERHFNESDLKALYEFFPEKDARKTPVVPKDMLLADMLIKHKSLIVGYHEHDSLLQKETEDELTEEERKQAWKEYEDERDGKTQYNPYANMMPQAGAGGAYQNMASGANGMSDTARVYMEYMQNVARLRQQQQQAAASQQIPANWQEIVNRPPHFNFTTSHPTLDLQKILMEVKLRNPTEDQLTIANQFRIALFSRRNFYATTLQRTVQSLQMYQRQKMVPPGASMEQYRQATTAVQILNSIIPKLDQTIEKTIKMVQEQKKRAGSSKGEPVPVVEMFDDTFEDDDVQVVEEPSSSSDKRPRRGGPVIEEID